MIAVLLGEEYCFGTVGSGREGEEQMDCSGTLKKGVTSSNTRSRRSPEGVKQGISRLLNDTAGSE